MDLLHTPLTFQNTRAFLASHKTQISIEKVFPGEQPHDGTIKVKGLEFMTDHVSDPAPQNLWQVQETYKSLITISIECLKMLALVNGGAAVAILTYLGNLVARSPQQAPHIGSALAWYCAGLFGTVVAFGLSYLVQLQLYQEKLARSTGRFNHQWVLWSAIAVVAFSAFSFAAGCWKAAGALGVW